MITDFKLLTHEPDKEYSAPEVKEGQPITDWSDVYSVGWVMLSLLTHFSDAKITWAERAKSLLSLLEGISHEA